MEQNKLRQPEGTRGWQIVIVARESKVMKLQSIRLFITSSPLSTPPKT